MGKVLGLPPNKVVELLGSLLQVGATTCSRLPVATLVVMSIRPFRLGSNSRRVGSASSAIVGRVLRVRSEVPLVPVPLGFASSLGAVIRRVTCSLVVAPQVASHVGVVTVAGQTASVRAATGAAKHAVCDLVDCGSRLDIVVPSSVGLPVVASPKDVDEVVRWVDWTCTIKEMLSMLK